MSESVSPLDLGRQRVQSIVGPPDSVWENLLSGALVGITAIVLNIGFAALIFSGPLAAYLPVGISVLLVTLMISSLVIALASSLPIMSGGPDAITAAILAIGVATIGPGEYSLDHALCLIEDLDGVTGLLIAAVGGVGAALAQLAIFYRPPAGDDS